MRYDAVLLDLDDTVLDFRKSENAAFRATALNFGFDPELYESYHLINKGLWKALERGEVTKDRLKVLRYEQLATQAGISYDPSEVSRFYGERLAEGFFLMPGAAHLLKKMQGRVKVYFCTNGIAAVQQKRIAGSGIGLYPDGVFISENIGAEKPSRAFYDHVFAHIPHTPERVIAYGDSLSSDIAGALGYGIDCCLFAPSGSESTLPTYTVQNHEAFWEIIK